jgi:hypothetical protein
VLAEPDLFRDIRHIEPTFVRDNLEAVGQSDHSLGSPEHEIAVARRRPCKAIEHADFRFRIEIDQNIPAQDQVEAPEPGEIRQEIELLVFDHRADIRRDLPKLADLGEMLDQKLDR